MTWRVWLIASQCFSFAFAARRFQFFWSRRESVRVEGLRSGGSNLVLLALNWLRGGRVNLVSNIVTAARRRIIAQVEYALKALVLTDEPTMGPTGARSFFEADADSTPAQVWCWLWA